jgi:hypothetical protein
VISSVVSVAGGSALADHPPKNTKPTVTRIGFPFPFIIVDLPFFRWLSTHPRVG